MGALGIIMTWPLAADPAGSATGMTDVLLNSWILSWDAQKLLTNPLGLYQANIFYPHPDTLTYSENLFGLAPLALLLKLFGAGPLLSHNLIFLLTFPLTGWAGWWWIRRSTGSWFGGLVAGLVFAFCPFKMGHPDHLQLQIAWWFPLGLLALWLYLQNFRQKYLIWLGVCFIGQWLCCLYYGLFMTLALAACLGLALAGRSELRSARRLIEMGLVGAVAVLILVGLLWPYFNLPDQGFARQAAEIKMYTPGPKDFLTLHPGAWLAKVLPQPKAYPERALYPGLIALGLGLIALLAVWPRGVIRDHRLIFGLWLAALVVAGHGLLVMVYGRNPPLSQVWTWFQPGAAIIPLLAVSLAWLIVSGRSINRAWWQGLWGFLPAWLITLAVIGFVFCQGLAFQLHGYDILPAPFYYFRSLPGFDSIRVPARFGIVFMLGLSGLAGLGAAWLWERLSRVRGPGKWLKLILVVIPVLILVEGANLPWPSVAVPSPGQGVYQDLAKQPLGPVIILPPVTVEKEARAVYDSTAHFYPLVNGYSGFLPSGYQELMTKLRSFPQAETVGLLRRMGIRYVIDQTPSLPEVSPGLELISHREGRSLWRIELQEPDKNQGEL